MSQKLLDFRVSINDMLVSFGCCLLLDLLYITTTDGIMCVQPLSVNFLHAFTVASHTRIIMKIKCEFVFTGNVGP